MFTFEGGEVSPDSGTPSIYDIAVQLSREGRYAGATQRFWPVSLHCLAIADILPRRMEHHALLHDSAEVLTGDIPKPFKIPEMKALEERLLHRIYEDLQVDFPTPDDRRLLRAAERRIFTAEVHLLGPRGAWGTYVPAIVDEDAENILQTYLSVPSEDYLNPNGGAVKLFCWRLRDAVQRAKGDKEMKEWLASTKQSPQS